MSRSTAPESRSCSTAPGVTGPDGPSHHGIWDLAMLQIVPHIRIAVPRDAERLQEELREAVAVDDAPTVIRFPKGSVSPDAARSGAPRATASTCSCARTPRTC